MCSKHLGASFVVAWPTAEIAVMGPEGAANIIFKKEIETSDDPEATRKEMVMEYEEKFMNPYIAASRGYIDLIIDPQKTRETLITALNVAETRKISSPTRRHGNMPT